MSDDIVSRLRQTRVDMIGTDDESHYWDCQDAAAEIERLRGYRDEAEAEASIASLAALRLRLTDAEREAIAWVCGDVADITGPTEDTLRGLLERTK